MKKQHILTFLLASVLVALSVHGVEAQSSIGGDDICGSSASSKCSFSNAKTEVAAILLLFLKIAVTLLAIIIPFRIILAYKARVEGNAGALKTLTTQLGNGLIGFLVILAVVGGLGVVLLQYLGVDQQLLRLFSDSFIPHAYATDSQLLPNSIPGVTSFSDFLVTVVKLVMSFFIYPALIAMWVWSGFAYVAAQGNPEAIKKAHQWLTWAVVSTVIIFMTQGLILALQGTVNSVLPPVTTQQQVNPVQPIPSEPAPPDDISSTNQPAGALCYSNNNCSSGLACKFTERGDKGTCQIPVATCSNGTTNPPVCTMCPSPKVLVGNTCTTPTNNQAALDGGCGVTSARAGDRCSTAFIPYGTCQTTSGSLKCQEQTGLSDCSLLSQKGRPCSTPTAPYGVCDVYSTSWDNTSFCKAR